MISRRVVLIITFTLTAVLFFALGAWHERSNRIDDDNVDCSASNQDFGNFQGLLAAVGLRDEEIFNVDAELARIIGVEGVLRVHEGRRSAKFLGFGENVQPVVMDSGPTARVCLVKGLLPDG